MTPSRLAALVASATDHLVCFERDGTERSWRELVAAAASVAAQLRSVDGERWALNLGGGFEAAAALLGCWAAGRTPVIAPATLLTTLDSAALDGVIELAGDATPAPARIVWQDLTPTRDPLPTISARAALVLYTSGSTGVPKAARRRLFNIESELGALEAVFGQRLGRVPVFATASHRHVYGLLFRTLWPLLERRPFATFDYEYPEQLLGTASRGNVLISSPAMLKRIGHLPAGSGQWRAIFSSGGFLPPEAARDVERVLGVEPVEVLGSTETSGVAWRTPSTSGFELLPSVEVRAAADDLLEVRSPFAGADGWQSIGDRVAFRGDGRFDLLGRADRIAKIEDKRVSLSEIERRLLEHAYVKDAVAVALEDDARQYVGAVIELTQIGREAIAAHGKRAVGSALRTSLRGRIDAVALPRAFRYPSAMPVDAQGKRQIAALARLFGRTP
ncbi:MAG TPA: class I adenylate-forming enzyme family protein [Gammaproteobacteria bacterium]|nr:class I adenylate-forming enzyme family protein [Gammaproteobacteria bacterium]